MSNSKGIQQGAQFLQKHHSVKNWFYKFECRKAIHELHRARDTVSFQQIDLCCL